VEDVEDEEPESQAVERPEEQAKVVMEDIDPDNDERTKDLFEKEIVWSDFSFSKNNAHAKFDEICPVGGPGGLICCEFCSRRYHLYLTKMAEDMETHRIQQQTNEMKDIIIFVNGAKDELKTAVKDAQGKEPPSRLEAPERVGTRPQVRRQDTTMEETNGSMAVLGNWNMTSTIDVGRTVNQQVDG
jgi:hypothetical protein